MLARTAHHWHTLSDDEQALWRTAASQLTHTNALGQRIKYTGCQLATKHNFFRCLARIPLINVPPTHISAPQPRFANIRASTFHIYGSACFMAPITHRRVWYFAQRCYSHQIKHPNFWTFIKYKYGTACETDHLETEYEAKLGWPPYLEMTKYRVITEAVGYLMASPIIGAVPTGKII